MFLFGLLVVKVVKVLLFFFGLLFLLLILFILHLLFRIFSLAPGFVSDLFGFFGIIGDQNVIENGTGLDLPQIETNFANLVIFAQLFGLISIVFGILNFGVHPFAFVLRVINLTGFPFSLVFGVIDHGWLPFTVHFIVPILGFGGIGIGNVFGLIPILGFGVFGVIDFSPIVPIFGFAGFGILDHLGWQKVPVFI